MSDWKTIESAPKTGNYVVKGGHYDTAYSQMHGFSHEKETNVTYSPQSNPDVDPPYRVTEGEPGLYISDPTHWKTEENK